MTGPRPRAHANPGREPGRKPGREPSTTAEEQLVEATGPFWSEARTRDALGLDDVELRAAVSAGSVLGLPLADGSLIFPIWQFTSTTEGIRVHSALQPVLATLMPHDPWSVALILNNPAEELENRSVAEIARDAHDATARLVEFAEMISAEWSAGTYRDPDRGG